MKIVSILFLSLFFSVQTQAQINDVHLNIGDVAPVITGVDQFGKKINSSEILKESEILLIFYRGSWCPYCSKHLKELQENLDALSAKGYYVVVVSPEKVEKTKEMSDKIQARFSILHDSNNKIMDDYLVSFDVNAANLGNGYSGTLKRVEAYNVPGNTTLPVPATYIIGKNGRVSFVHYDPDYKNRFDVKGLL
ncbi:AhpC/TSA family protein [Flavobacteriaceae bacterium F08102]|nr:AhpC/TSA family protein [Flavobacteriaceae bacterium F08102]